MSRPWYAITLSGKKIEPKFKIPDPFRVFVYYRPDTAKSGRIRDRQETEMSNGHDQLFKDLIRAYPADFVTIMDPVIARRIDLARLQFRAEELFLDVPKGRQLRLDLVGEARTKPGLAADPTLLHTEIELRYRATVPPRLWHYNQVAELRSGLPAHTFVVYLHGGSPGITRQVEYASALGRSRGCFRYTSLGLSRADPEAFLARPEPLAWALAALMKPRSKPRKITLRTECLRRIAAADGVNPVQRFLLFNCVATYLKLDGRAAEEYQALLAEHGNLEVPAMAMTWADEMKEQGRQEGLESMRTLILRLLKQRFTSLPERIVRAISSIASTEKLAAVGEQVLVVDSPDDLDLD